ncbi:MAG TPA: hypothetical protein VEJ16_16250 [Alphaproteobacteria bacterium]|nr:hypothetical protein [Alphaproteobacteria bacterium]
MSGFKRRLVEAEDGRLKAILLAELANEGVDVFCWCNRCGHNAVVPTRNLIAALGPAFPVPEVGSQMRCMGCGAKDVATRPAWPSLGSVANHL